MASAGAVRRGPGARALVVGGLLVLNVTLAYSSASRKSVTVDEFANLPHGLALLQGGALHVDPGSPPLPRVLPALAARLAGSPHFDPAPIASRRSSWELGRLFVAADAAGYQRHFMHGRVATMLVLLLLVGLAIGLARALYGTAGGVLTGAVVALEPSLLAHGRLVTPDVYVTAAVVGALWALHAWHQRPAAWRAVVLGVAVGAAVLCKLTGLLLLGLLPLASVLARPPDLAWRRVVGGFAIAGAAALLVVNLGYAFAETGTRVGAFAFATPAARAVQALLPAWLPVPVPAVLVRGLDAQLGETGYASYLLGTFSDRGFWSYYLVALLVKLPVPVLLLAAAATLLGPRLTAVERPLVVVAGGVLLFFTVAGQRNIGLRYVLAVIPLLGVWIGRLTVGARWRRPGTWLRASVAGAVAWLLVGTLAAWPHYLPYFNVASGGPGAGHRYLLDSNLDWGQDLLALRDYMRAEGIATVDLAYCGRVPPAVYGIRHRALFDDRVRASHAVVSANFLYGRRYFVNGTTYWPVDDAYAAFRRLTPTAVLGHTLYVFGPEALAPLRE